jgi:hypothetical protein
MIVCLDKKDDQIIIEYQESTVHHTLVRPSVERYQSPLTRELVTRNMKTKFVDSSNFNMVEVLKFCFKNISLLPLLFCCDQDTKSARSNLMVAPIMDEFHTVACIKSCHTLKTAEISDK